MKNKIPLSIIIVNDMNKKLKERGTGEETGR